ncbi:MAG: hypothetical protein J7621_09405 [Niastella sp.]|nr:hypothetical protein [Niastella sp.]
MKKKKDLFSQLRSKYTLEEIADAFVFPVELTPEQQKEAKEELAKARMKGQEEMTEEVRIDLELFGLKFRMEQYLQGKIFDPAKTFGSFLSEYIEVFEAKRKDFAEQISIDETLLSQLINEHRMPPEYVLIRLEIHSNNIIPANYWYKLVEKQKEHELIHDKSLRKREIKYVHRISA